MPADHRSEPFFVNPPCPNRHARRVGGAAQCQPREPRLFARLPWSQATLSEIAATVCLRRTRLPRGCCGTANTPPSRRFTRFRKLRPCDFLNFDPAAEGPHCASRQSTCAARAWMVGVLPGMHGSKNAPTWYWCWCWYKPGVVVTRRPQSWSLAAAQRAERPCRTEARDEALTMVLSQLQL